MKKGFRIFAPGFVVCSLALLAGCGGGGGGSKSSTTRSIVGTWKQTQIGDAANLTGCPTTILLPDGSSANCGSEDEVVFKSDGTFAGDTSSGVISGTYTYSNGTVHLFVGGDEASAAVEFDGDNKMTFKYAQGGGQERDVYQRQ